jgi:hypothetical protein
MRAHDGAIEHQVTVVAILRQRREDPLPHPGVRPPAEALMHRLPSAIALRQVTPVRARPKHHKQPFTNNRLSVPLRPGSPALPGSKGPIRSHCSSLNSYRLIPIIRLRVQTRNLMNQTESDLGILNVDPS